MPRAPGIKLKGVRLLSGEVVEFSGGLSLVVEVTDFGAVLESAGGVLQWVAFQACPSAPYRGALKISGKAVAIQEWFVLGSVKAFMRAEAGQAKPAKRKPTGLWPVITMGP